MSDASVIRFAQKVGFSGLNEFRYILQSELERENTIINQNSYTSLMHDYNTLTETLFKFTKPEYVDLLRKKMRLRQGIAVSYTHLIPSREVITEITTTDRRILV